MNAKQLKKLYERGEISREIYEYMKQSNRKMRYQAYDLKAERTTIEGETVTPSREDSYDRLLEAGKEFSTGESVEDVVIKALFLDQLRDAIDRLDPGEKRLIIELFYSSEGNGKTEREAAKSLGMPQKTLNDRKLRIFEKIRKLLEN